MKKNYPLPKIMLMIITAMLINGSFNSVRACVDYHPVPPPMTVTLDTALTHIEIRIHNLHLFGGSNGQFCTCAFGAYATLFSNVYYVAFVDSGTSNPVAGFDAWNGNSNASGAWTSLGGGGTWDGFVAAVNINGLPPGSPVELLWKATLTNGLSLSYIDTTLYGSQLGTDAFDTITQMPSNMHLSISGLYIDTQHLVSTSYFTGIKENEQLKSYITIYPNPVTEKLYFNMKKDLGDLEVSVTDISGRIILKDIINTRKNILSMKNIKNGNYIVSLKNKNGKIYSENIFVDHREP